MADEKKDLKETGNSKADISRNFSDVMKAERIHLNVTDKEEMSGIAFSGGGIRSASFGLGVMQALVGNDQFEKMDYMSTVSGGGYLGSALTWALKQGGANAGTSKDKFPLGKKGMSSGLDETHNYIKRNSQNNGLLDYIRQHSSYLVPTDSLGMISFVGVVLRSIMLSLFVYFSFLVIGMTVFKLCGLYSTDVFVNIFQNFIPSYSIKGIFLPVTVILILLLAVMGLLYSLRTFVSSESGFVSEYLGFIRGQKLIGFLWKLILTLVALGSLPFIQELIGKKMSAGVGSGTTLYGIAVGIWQYKKAQKNEESSGTMSDLVIYLAAFALVFGLLLLSFITADSFIAAGWKTIVVFAILTFIFSTIVNLNLIGPHRIWRDRLMEAFMPDEEAVMQNNWKPAKKADSALMEDMCDENNRRPYHIVNTNIILGNSRKVKYKGRGGDNFILSPLYCGSEATGWRTTKTFQKKDGRGVTLASAMATSAAALNPDAGVSGEGVTRNTIVSILLSFLNLRLGYWLGNPAKDISSFPPNFIVPGLKAEIMRKGFKETDSKILLSDGGHFENLAIYELIRRKLNLIVVSDGGADPHFNFDDLANVVEKVRVDFSAQINFKNEYDLSGILPGTNSDCDYNKKYQVAKRGYAIAEILYNDGTKGTLVYLKLAMIHGLPTDVYSYKGINPSFPHESTADQFFDEKQFEAYRELGYYVTWQMMRSDEGKKLFPGIGL